MNQPAPPSESNRDDRAGAPVEAASPRDRAVEAMVASVEQLDELGLDAVEPAAAFRWPE